MKRSLLFACALLVCFAGCREISVPGWPTIAVTPATPVTPINPVTPVTPIIDVGSVAIPQPTNTMGMDTKIPASMVTYTDKAAVREDMLNLALLYHEIGDMVQRDGQASTALYKTTDNLLDFEDMAKNAMVKATTLNSIIRKYPEFARLIVDQRVALFPEATDLTPEKRRTAVDMYAAIAWGCYQASLQAK